MKKLKILSVMIAVILMFGAFSICSFAEENQSINYNVSVNVLARMFRMDFNK